MENDTYTPPLIIIGVEPKEKITLENFFSEENNALYDLLRNPPYLRYAGWNLLTLNNPIIKNGKCWEVKNGERKTIRIYRDGTLIAIGYADDSFLAWGAGHEDFIKFPLLNSLAVVEYTYEFVELYKNMLEHIPKINRIIFKIGIKDVQIFESKKIYFKPSEVSDPWYKTRLDINELTPVTDDFYESINIDITSNYDSKHIAYILLSELLVHFNIPTDKIPYTFKDNNGIGYVDADRIKELR